MRTTSVLCLLLLGGCAAANEPLPRPGVLRARTIPHADGTIEPVQIKANTVQSLSLGTLSLCQTHDRMPTLSPGQVAPMPRATSPGTSAHIPNACAVTRGAPGPKGSVPGVLRAVEPVQVPGPRGGVPGVLRPREPVQASPREPQP